MPEALLLTGATGFLGRSVLARVLERTDRQVVVPVRAEDSAHATARVREVLDGLVDPTCAAPERLVAVPCDLATMEPGAVAADLAGRGVTVDEIVHSAACVSFDQSLEDARHTNVGGTANVLELSGLLHGRHSLRRHVHVSTAYVAGDRSGPIAEDDAQCGQGFRNTYEQSKLEAEELVRAASHLPIQIVRPSIVVGEASSGWTSAFNVLYVPLRALASGGMAAVPSGGGLADVVPVDYVADAILGLEDAPATGLTYHLTAGDRAVNLEQLVRLTCDETGHPAPPVVSRERFRDQLGDHATARLLLAHLDAYLPYMEVRARFDASRARAHLVPRGIEVPRLDVYLGALLRFAAATRWGRNPVSRIAARAAALPA
jgi:thioester reductase-like protein